MSEHFSTNDIIELSKLARITLRDDEVLRLTSDLNVINDSIEKIQEVASADVPATSHPIPISNVLREDIPATLHIPATEKGGRIVDGLGENPYEGDLLSLEQAISGAPEAENGQFVTPQILGEE